MSDTQHKSINRTKIDRRIDKHFMQSYWSALQFAPTNLPVFLPWHATGIPRKKVVAPKSTLHLQPRFGQLKTSAKLYISSMLNRLLRTRTNRFDNYDPTCISGATVECVVGALNINRSLQREFHSIFQRAERHLFPSLNIRQNAYLENWKAFYFATSQLYFQGPYSDGNAPPKTALDCSRFVTN